MMPDPRGAPLRRPRRAAWRRVLRRTLVVAAAAAIGLCVVLPIGLGVFAVLPGGGEVGEPPAGAQNIVLEGPHGERLAAWYLPPRNGAVIIVLHGAGGSREDVRGHLAVLARHGYGVLALDQRGHGESEGQMNRLGWGGTGDVATAAAFLEDQPAAHVIGGLGLSMGGEVLLGAVGDVPAVKAVVAEGATRRSIDDLMALPSERPLSRNLSARIWFATVGVLSGDEPRPLLDSMKAARDTSFLLIAAGDEDLEVGFSELYEREVGERVQVWRAPDTPHTGALARYPEEYERRVVVFFDEALAE